MLCDLENDEIHDNNLCKKREILHHDTKDYTVILYVLFFFGIVCVFIIERFLVCQSGSLFMVCRGFGGAGEGGASNSLRG